MVRTCKQLQELQLQRDASGQLTVQPALRQQRRLQSLHTKPERVAPFKIQLCTRQTSYFCYNFTKWISRASILDLRLYGWK